MTEIEKIEIEKKTGNFDTNLLPQRLRVLFMGMDSVSIGIVRKSPLFEICEKSMNAQESFICETR